MSNFLHDKYVFLHSINTVLKTVAYPHWLLMVCDIRFNDDMFSFFLSLHVSSSKDSSVLINIYKSSKRVVTHSMKECAIHDGQSSLENQTVEK